MRLVRFNSGGSTSYGVLDGDSIRQIMGEPFAEINYSGATFSLADVKLLAPVEPKKIVLVGLNFASHAAEIHQETPSEPLIFFKPSSAVVASGEEIVLPHQSTQVEIEAELTVVIGKRAKNVSQEKVSDHILGYTVANDVTARDIQFSDLQWARSKAFDSFVLLAHGLRLTLCQRISESVQPLMARPSRMPAHPRWFSRLSF